MKKKTPPRVFKCKMFHRFGFFSIYPTKFSTPMYATAPQDINLPISNEPVCVLQTVLETDKRQNSFSSFFNPLDENGEKTKRVTNQ